MTLAAHTVTLGNSIVKLDALSTTLAHAPLRLLHVPSCLLVELSRLMLAKLLLDYYVVLLCAVHFDARRDVISYRLLKFKWLLGIGENIKENGSKY